MLRKAAKDTGCDGFYDGFYGIMVGDIADSWTPYRRCFSRMAKALMRDSRIRLRVRSQLEGERLA
jgi:hypothetical protein